MALGGLAQPVEDDARLDARQLCGGVDGSEAIHVPGEIEDDRDVGALAGQAGARAARQNGCSCSAAGCQRCLHIGGVAGQNHAHGKLAVIRRIGSVKGARAEIEADVAAQALFEQCFQLAMGGKALMVERRLIHQLGDGWNAHDGMVARCGERRLKTLKTGCY